MRFLRLTFGLLCFIALVVLTAGGIVAGQNQKPRNAVPVSEVHGYVFVKSLDPAKAASASPVPDITVYLKDPKTSMVVGKGKSGTIGGYVIPDCPIGNYVIYWEGDGFVSGQGAQTIEVKDQLVSYAGVAYAVPKPGVLFGRVTLKDGSLPGFSDPFWNLDIRPQVSLVDAGGTVVKSVRTNVQGEYVLPGVPAGQMKVRAVCEAASIEYDAPRSPTRLDLVLPNSAPKIGDLFATVKGQRIRQAAPGEIVGCVSAVSDPDGDQLQFSWQTNDDPLADQHILGTRKTSSTTLTLPQVPGLYSVYLLVGDGKGGYALGTLNISCGDTGNLLAPSSKAQTRKKPIEPSPRDSVKGRQPVSTRLVASTACMRVIVDTDKLRLPFNLRVTIPTPPQVNTVLVTEPLSVLSSLPPKVDIKLEVLDFDGRVIDNSTQTKNSGDAITGTDPPIYPFVECNSQVTLTASVPANTNFKIFFTYLDTQAGSVTTPETSDAYYAAIDPDSAFGGFTLDKSEGKRVTGFKDPVDASKSTQFLTFFKAGDVIRAAGQVRTITKIIDDNALLTFSPFNPAIAANTQYERVGKKTTFDGWKSVNGFTAGDDASAVYFNAGDLGFGRGMHMKRQADDISYFVSNYPTVDDARQNTNLIATVAMDYSAVRINGPRFTKFYVFDKDGKRVNNADLDGNGGKFIPTLCLHCHGGKRGVPVNGVFPSDGNVGAHFLPFDLESFQYSNFVDPNTKLSLFTRAAQEPAFKTLNTTIIDTDPPAAILSLVQGWYGGLSLQRGTADSSFVPDGWRIPSDRSFLYNVSVKTSCRSCHIAQRPDIDWSVYDNGITGFHQNPALPVFVDNQLLMPHAKQTYLNFWLSTSPHHRPATLRIDRAVVVTPTTGLVTTRAGGTATFTVALAFKPSNDVTIPVVTSNSSEGTVSVASLLFTSANFGTAQTVTVKGVNDTVHTGNISYTILLGPAQSADLGYNGIQPDIVNVVNQ